MPFSAAHPKRRQVDYARPVAFESVKSQPAEHRRRGSICHFLQGGTGRGGIGSNRSKGTTLRMLRSVEGYYFVTGSRFKNV